MVVLKRATAKRPPLVFIGLFQQAFFFPELFSSGVERGHDSVGSGFERHFLEGLFLGDHVSQAFIGVDDGQHVVHHVRRDLGVGYPKGWNPGMTERHSRHPCRCRRGTASLAK